MGYIYKYGDIEVYNKFQQPTKQIFHKWRNEFLQNNNLDNYNILFMGNAAEILFGISKLQTYDIDIILSGEIDSYENLSKLMNSAFSIGLKYNLCIDIFHLDINVFEIEWWSSYNKIRLYDRLTNSNGNVYHIPYKIEDLPFGLHKFGESDSIGKSHRKHLDRIQSGQYVGLRFDLKTMRLISFN